MAKNNESLNKKIDELTATVNLLLIELQGKDASVAQLKTENNALKTKLKAATQTNDDLQQELKRDSLLFIGFKPTYSEAVGSSVDCAPCISSAKTKDVFVKFCNDTLQLPSVNAADISSVRFLPQSGHSTTRVLAAHFVRCTARDKIYGRHRSLETYNAHQSDKIFTN